MTDLSVLCCSRCSAVSPPAPATVPLLVFVWANNRRSSKAQLGMSDDPKMSECFKVRQQPAGRRKAAAQQVQQQKQEQRGDPLVPIGESSQQQRILLLLCPLSGCPNFKIDFSGLLSGVLLCETQWGR